MIHVGESLKLQEGVAMAAIHPVALGLLDIDDHSSVGGVPRRWFWILGVLATLVGASLTVVGFMLQKRAHSFLKGQDPRYWTDWRWLSGLFVWIAGQALCWLADGLANKCLLACLNGWNIIVVFVLAPWCFRESVSKSAYMGALVIVAGCVWIMIAGPRAYYEQTLRSIGEGFSSRAFLSILGLSTFVPAFIYARRIYRSGMMPLAEEYAMLSAVFAWYAVLAAKCTSMLFVTTVRTKNQMNSWQFYVFAALLCVFAVAQMHTLNLALRRGAATLVLPIYEAFSMAGQLIICGVFFDEFRDFSVLALIVFWVGALVVVAGVVVLVRSVAAEAADDAHAVPEASVVDGLGDAHDRGEVVRGRPSSSKHDSSRPCHHPAH